MCMRGPVLGTNTYTGPLFRRCSFCLLWAWSSNTPPHLTWLSIVASHGSSPGWRAGKQAQRGRASPSLSAHGYDGGWRPMRNRPQRVDVVCVCARSLPSRRCPGLDVDYLQYKLSLVCMHRIPGLCKPATSLTNHRLLTHLVKKKCQCLRRLRLDSASRNAITSGAPPPLCTLYGEAAAAALCGLCSRCW